MSTGLHRQTVRVEPHDPEWESCAAETLNTLRRILGTTAAAVQHVGSTAIKGIYAKPIIDIVIGATGFDALFEYNEELEKNGFIFRGQDHPGQYLYVCFEGDLVTHHVHAVIYGSDEWNGYIDLRDYLNCHKPEAEAYSELKKSLASQYPSDRKTYTALKSDFISEILKKAAAWKKGGL